MGWGQTAPRELGDQQSGKLQSKPQSSGCENECGLSFQSGHKWTQEKTARRPASGITDGFLPAFTYQAFRNRQSGPQQALGSRPPVSYSCSSTMALRPWASATTTVCLSVLFVCCEKYQIYLHKHTKPSPSGTQQTLCQTFARFAGNTETRPCPVAPIPTSVTASCCPSTDGRTFLQVMTELGDESRRDLV